MGSWELRNGKAILPEGYARIEERKYENCINLTSIVFPKSVTEIGDSAFWGCENLKEIFFSDAITSIGDCAFCNCKSLKKVVLPKSLKAIGSSVFAGCENLKEVVIPDSVTSIGKELFGNNTFGEITVFKNGTAKDANGTIFKVIDSGMLTYDICDALKSVYCYVKDPKQIQLSPDPELNGYQATLYVPADSVDKYKMLRPWNKFKSIQKIPGTEKETPAQEDSTLRNTYSLHNNNKTMTKKLIPEELDLLIQECLTDGILTPKEREVILKEAERLGLDRDKIDVYLDAQVQKIEQATDAAVRRQKGKSCPHCGAYVPQLTDKCPECGQYITPEATQELAEILDNLEDAVIEMKKYVGIPRHTRPVVEKYMRKAKMYYGNNPKIKALLAEVESEIELVEKKSKVYNREKELRNLKESFVGIFKSKWFWGTMPIALGIIMIWYDLSDNSDGYENGTLALFSLFFFIPLAALGLLIMYLLDRRKK